MIRHPVKVMLGLAVFSGVAAYGAGLLPVPSQLVGKMTAKQAVADTKTSQPKPLPVSVTRARSADFRETVLLTGSLVPREEVLVSAQVTGLRIVKLGALEGDFVQKGQLLAELDASQLQAQIAQNTAALARAEANIRRAGNQIEEAKASLVEAQNAFQRGETLRSKGHIANSIFDIRQAALRTAKARLAAARDSLAVAKADQAQVEARGRELLWQLSNTKIIAPQAGIISSRTARLGAMASANGQPLFRIIAKGEIEFEAEVPEMDLPKLQVGQSANIKVSGHKALSGKIRLIYPEVNKLTRLGTLRIFIGVNPKLHIGTFARGRVHTKSARGIAVPLSAVSFSPEGAQLMVVVNGHAVVRKVSTGLTTGDLIEIKSGLSENELVIRRAGTFLRDGDAVTPINKTTPSLSEAF